MSATQPVRSLQSESTRTVVVYDAQDGHIIHTHTVITFSGAKEPSEREMEDRANLLAIKMGHNTRVVKFLHIGGDAMKAGVFYKVDIERHCLVVEENEKHKNTESSM